MTRGWSFTAVAIGVLIMSGDARALCPDPASGEAHEDCPWAEVGRELLHEARTGRPVLPVLESQLPQLRSQLIEDSTRQRWLSLWGESLNFDEGAKATIVDPAIYDAMTELLPVQPRRERVVHAGLEHTYAYLLSILKTPYGYKRARWTEDDIEAGFGLPRGTLGPSPARGTLLSNATYFFGNIALRDSPNALAALRADRAAVPEALRAFDYRALAPSRIEETVRFEGAERRTVVLRTDLIPFARAAAPGKRTSHLLIYSVSDSDFEHPVLITAFPIEKGYADSLLDPKGFGESVPVVTRYNAYVRNVTSVAPPLRGWRKLK